MRQKKSKFLRKLVMSNNPELFNIVFLEYKDKVANFTYKTMYRAAKDIWKKHKYRDEMKKLKVTTKKKEENVDERTNG